MSTLKQLALDANLTSKPAEADIIANQMSADAQYCTHYNDTNLGFADINNTKGLGIVFDSRHVDWSNHRQPAYSQEVVISNSSAMDGKLKNIAQSLEKMAMDDTAVYNAPNGNLPAYFTTIYSNKFIYNVQKAMRLTDVTEDWQIGMWGLTDVKIPTEAPNGQPKVYADASPAGNSSVNYNWVPREFIYSQQMVTVGDMELARYGMAKIDIIDRKRVAAAISMAQLRNDMGFVGVEGMQIYGLLNDPSLPAVLSNPNGVSGFPQFSKKTYEECVATFMLYVKDLATRGGGHFDQTQKMTWIIPPSVQEALSGKQTTLGYTFQMFLKENFPNLTIVISSNYETALTGRAVSGANTYAQLILDEVQGQRVAYNLFNTLYFSHGMVRQASQVEEKISNGLGGAFIAQAMGISTLSAV